MATATKERPILFSGPMVRAILEGRKTQTRRIVKFDKLSRLVDWKHVEYARDGMPIWWAEPPDESIRQSDYYDTGFPCPYGRPGDRLWVRETLRQHNGVAVYAAEYPQKAVPVIDPGNEPFAIPWRWKRGSLPSIHMPRWASRIDLGNSSVRVERLQDISEEDAKAEGVQPDIATDHPRGPWYTAFQAYWKEINGADSWAANPWVWVIEFKRVGE